MRRRFSAEGENDAQLFEHTLKFLDYFVVPKPQYRIALATQPRISILIVLHLFGMLSTIDFYNQQLLDTYKIHDIATYGFLPLELQTHETMCTQLIPQPLFGYSLVGA